MAVREIITIDEELCDGCGLCVPACAEGAIQLIDGKAKLISDKFCDGLGNCLGECPQGAITIEQREADDYDQAAVDKHLSSDHTPLKNMLTQFSGCPGAASRTLQPEAPVSDLQSVPSQLGHWPVQLMLVPPTAPYLHNADLLICADCVPFAVPDFHTRWLTGKAVLVGCPKLDDLQFYLQKLTETFKTCQPRSITVLKMEVPCCTGIAQATEMARDHAAVDVPMSVHTIGVRGDLLTSEEIGAGTPSRVART